MIRWLFAQAMIDIWIEDDEKWRQPRDVNSLKDEIFLVSMDRRRCEARVYIVVKFNI